MTELDAFRPRIINWARAYRDRSSRAQSPLAVVLHDLKMRAGTNGPAEVLDELSGRIDQRDADLLDGCAKRLARDHLRVLRMAYLERRTTLDYETEQDARRADHVRARRLGLESGRQWRRLLFEAEEALMLRVHSVETCLDNCPDK
jgi:hypothetical protein